MSNSPSVAASSGRSRRARIAAWIARVERLDASAEHLRHLGERLDTLHVEPGSSR